MTKMKVIKSTKWIHVFSTDDLFTYRLVYKNGRIKLYKLVYGGTLASKMS